MKLLGCFLVIYLATVAQAMQGEMLGIVDLLIVSIVFAVRWCSPPVAAILAFLAGLLADGVSSGPIGAHAAANVAAVTVVTRWGPAQECWSLGRWITAILCLVGANTAVLMLTQLGPLFRGNDWERMLISQSATALATAVVVVLLVCSGRLLSGGPCATR